MLPQRLQGAGRSRAAVFWKTDRPPSSQRKAAETLDGNCSPQESCVMETEALSTNTLVPLRNMSPAYILLVLNDLNC